MLYCAYNTKHDIAINNARRSFTDKLSKRNSLRQRYDTNIINIKVCERYVSNQILKLILLLIKWTY